jgi:hypothetical protein
MDNLSLILTALAMGAAAGVQQTAKNIINDTYNSLKELIKGKSSDQLKTETTLVDYEEDSEGNEKPLRNILSANHLEQDEEIITVAYKLLALVQTQQADVASNIIQNLGNVHGQVIENTGSISMNFNYTPN